MTPKFKPLGPRLAPATRSRLRQLFKDREARTRRLEALACKASTGDTDAVIEYMHAMTYDKNPREEILNIVGKALGFPEDT